MKVAGAKKQTLFLTGINAVVRILGFCMRVWTSRYLGAEILGVMELAQSVHMMAIAPFTSGLPVAISRLTAKSRSSHQSEALAAGLSLVRRFSCFLIPAFLLFSPAIARLMGDVRVIPSLWFSAPCIVILGYSAAYNGFCYGTDQAALPAISELIEQLVRFFLTVLLVRTLSRLTVPWLAAVPTAATMIAELIGLYYVLWFAGNRKTKYQPSSAWRSSVYRLAAPATLTRLIQTFFRSATAVMIPNRLQTSGLSVSEATTQLGQLNGMVAPVLMLPGIFTSALSMVTIPRMAKAEEKPGELKRLLVLNLCCSVPLAAACAACVYFLGPVLANNVFHQPEILPLFRLSAFQMILVPINHVLTSTLSALGQQRSTLAISLASSLGMLVLVWHLASLSEFRVYGVVYAQYASMFISILLNVLALLKWRKTAALKLRGKCV